MTSPDVDVVRVRKNERADVAGFPSLVTRKLAVLRRGMHRIIWNRSRRLLQVRISVVLSVLCE